MEDDICNENNLQIISITSDIALMADAAPVSCALSTESLITVTAKCTNWMHVYNNKISIALPLLIAADLLVDDLASVYRRGTITPAAFVIGVLA